MKWTRWKYILSDYFLSRNNSFHIDHVENQYKNLYFDERSHRSFIFIVIRAQIQRKFFVQSWRFSRVAVREIPIFQTVEHRYWSRYASSFDGSFAEWSRRDDTSQARFRKFYELFPHPWISCMPSQLRIWLTRCSELSPGW